MTGFWGRGEVAQCDDYAQREFIRQCERGSLQRVLVLWDRAGYSLTALFQADIRLRSHRRTWRESPMNCFNHRTSPAIGICKSCGKGVCQGCAVDTGNGLACRDSCESRVRLLTRMVDNNAKVMKTANAQSRSAGIYGLITGSVFLAMGWYAYTANQMMLVILLGGIGLPLLLIGLVRLFGERYPVAADEEVGS